MLCAEQALTQGGSITIGGTADAVEITASGGPLNPRPEHWDWLKTGAPPSDVPAAQVQFLMLYGLATDMGRSVEVEMSTKAVTLRV